MAGMHDHESQMLTYHRTSALDSNAQTVVNTVNCVGVMGKGIAAEYKDRYPEMFKAYKVICDNGELSPGRLWLWKGPSQWVLNFPTKVHWRQPSRLEWIEAGLEKFASEYETRGITEISFPRLGCGHGNLKWSDVKPLMERYLSCLPISVYVHDYSVDIGVPEHLKEISDLVSKRSVFDGSLENFSDSLEAIVSEAGRTLVDLYSGERFEAFFSNESLVIRNATETFELEREDLRAIWLTLVRGLLTQDKMGWPDSPSTTRLMSLISLLPCARPVEIQKPKSESAELAVEFRRKPGAVEAKPNGEQFSLAWH